MKVETVTVMQRKNLGNYEHLEISATAKIEEGEEAFSSILSLKTLIQAALEAKANERAQKIEETNNQSEKKDQEAQEEVAIPSDISNHSPVEEKPKAKRGRKPKDEVKAEDNGFNGQDIPPVIPSETKKVKSKDITYDRSVDAHKNALSVYLSNTFPGWKVAKPREEIIAFTSSLEGKPFMDESGEILDSFKDILKGFFGA